MADPNARLVQGSATGTPLPVSGTFSLGAADNSDFVAGTTLVDLIAGVFNDALADLAAGKYGATRITAKRAAHVNLRNVAGNELFLSSTPGFVQQVDTLLSTYSTAASVAPPAAATDVFEIRGSATKTIKVRKVILTAISNPATILIVTLVKRSTANTGGTAVTATPVPNDSNNAAATATVKYYSVNPTVGTSVGAVRAEVFQTTVGSTPTQELTFDFGGVQDQPITLRGTAESLCLNLNGATVVAGNFQITAVFTEE